MGRRKGDWVCKKCHRANVWWSKVCDRCSKIKEIKITPIKEYKL